MTSETKDPNEGEDKSVVSSEFMKRKSLDESTSDSKEGDQKKTRLDPAIKKRAKEKYAMLKAKFKELNAKGDLSRDDMNVLLEKIYKRYLLDESKGGVKAKVKIHPANEEIKKRALDRCGLLNTTLDELFAQGILSQDDGVSDSKDDEELDESCEEIVQKCKERCEKVSCVLDELCKQRSLDESNKSVQEKAKVDPASEAIKRAMESVGMVKTSIDELSALVGDLEKENNILKKAHDLLFQTE